MAREPQELFNDIVNQIDHFSETTDAEKYQILIDIREFLSLAFNLGND